ncbi:conserved Plasmodium protein, unknown function [Plasmodium sp. gorilla clade G2]|uniref:conserved Plasmodium protein, unknown function n=1 Tax=Plasmodium sp. gorilla clade G2 TaxID=880535 RepID=UPI000D20093A|nr:conserved Plasmodium protein, unknown function [Plasmodium sp. gorilla clade G2]SOV10537.1 conserved Plasmodium protein, unknown function [Plasmodium sp. gorilla clade G2]
MHFYKRIKHYRNILIQCNKSNRNIIHGENDTLFFKEILYANYHICKRYIHTKENVIQVERKENVDMNHINNKDDICYNNDNKIKNIEYEKNCTTYEDIENSYIHNDELVNINDLKDKIENLLLVSKKLYNKKYSYNKSLCNHKAITLNNIVLNILSIINGNNNNNNINNNNINGNNINSNNIIRNKDIYIDKFLLLDFYNLLIKRKYYIHNLKNNIYDNSFMNIFDYIHYNINLHLKNYNLKNTHQVLHNISIYIHKNKCNNITHELVKNIFFFSFFKNFNKFYSKKEEKKLINESEPNFHNYPNQKYYNKYKSFDEETFSYLNTYVVFLSNHPSFINDKLLYNISLLANKILQLKINFKLALSFLSASLNIFEKQEKKIKEGHLILNIYKKKTNYDILYSLIQQHNEMFEKRIADGWDHQDYDNSKEKKKKMTTLNVSKQNGNIHNMNGLNENVHNMNGLNENIHNMNGLNENIHNMNGLNQNIHNMNGLNQNVYNMNGLNQNIHNMNGLNQNIHNMNRLNQNVHNMNRLNQNIHICSRKNLDILSNERKKKYMISTNHVTNNTHIKNIYNHNLGFLKNDYINLWNYSHIINIIKILQMNKFVSPNYNIKTEECVKTFLKYMFDYLSIYYDELIIMTQNELNSFISIYVNLSIILYQMRNYKDDICSLIICFLINSYKRISIYYNSLHINMMINLIKGIYHQIYIYSKIFEDNNLFFDQFKEELIILCNNINTSDIISLNYNNMYELINTHMIYLSSNICNTIFDHPFKDNKYIPFNKLITVIHYLHKMNKICLSYDNTINIFQQDILKFIKKCENIFLSNNHNFYDENLSNHHILILINIYIYYYYYYKTSIHSPFLYKCLQYLSKKNDPTLFMNETEIIMYLNLLKKLKEIKINNINEKFKNNANYLGQIKQNVLNNVYLNNIYEMIDNYEPNNIYQTNNESVITSLYYNNNTSHFVFNTPKNIYEEKKKINKDLLNLNLYDEMLKSYMNKIMDNLFFSSSFIQYNNKMWEESKKKNKTINNINDIIKIDDNKKDERINIYNTCTSSSKCNKFPFNIHHFKKYSINTYFLVYENIFSYNKKIDKEVIEKIWVILNNIIKYKQNVLTEENFFFIISALLKAQNFEHEIYKMYYEYMKKYTSSINIKYIFLIMKRIFEDTPYIKYQDDTSLCIDKDNNILNNCGTKYNIGSSYCYNIKNDKYNILNDIIKLSEEIILSHVNYIKHFTFFKEILHTYMKKEIYIKCSLLYQPHFNDFILNYFNKFLTHKYLHRNVLVFLINNISSFYYTLNNNYASYIIRNNNIQMKCDDRIKEKTNKEYNQKKDNEKLIDHYEDINLSDEEKIKTDDNKDIKLVNKYKNGYHSKIFSLSQLDQIHLNIQLNKENIILTKDKTNHSNIYSNMLLTCPSNDITSYNYFIDIKMELLKKFNIFLHTLYMNDIKNKSPHEIKLSSMNIIDIFVSLKNIKIRNEDIMYILSQKYIMDIFFHNNKVKLEYQIKFLNSLTFLDYIKEADSLFKTFCLKKNKINNIQKEENKAQNYYNLLYTHFLKIPIKNCINIPNISSYILNFISIYDYFEKKDQYVIYKKLLYFIEEYLQLHNKINSMNSLDKRNIILITLLLYISSSPLNISSMSLQTLRIFYYYIIEFNYFYKNNITNSSATHDDIFKLVVSCVRKHSLSIHISNEINMHCFDVDMLLYVK